MNQPSAHLDHLGAVAEGDNWSAGRRQPARRVGDHPLNVGVVAGGVGLVARAKTVYRLDHNNCCSATPQDNTPCELWFGFYGERWLGFQQSPQPVRRRLRRAGGCDSATVCGVTGKR